MTDTLLQPNNVKAMLSQVYEYLDDGFVSSAKAALEFLLQANPNHVEAWEVRFQVSDTKEELDRVYSKAIHEGIFSLAEREMLLESYMHLRQQYGKQAPRSEEMFVFQLVDQFEYSVKDSPCGPNDPCDSWLDTLFATTSSTVTKFLLPIYIAVLIAGVRQVANGSYFGYWVIMGLIVVICIHLWTVLVNTKEPAGE